MFKSKNIAFIVNLAAAGGAAGRDWPRIESLVRDRLGPFQRYLTASRGDGIQLTRRAILDEGADLVVCVGGDGTLNEVVNGFMAAQESIGRRALLGYIPRGTGCDFVKTVPIPRELNRAVDTIVSLRTRFIDLGRIHYTNRLGRPCRRYFHNIASFGLGGEVAGRLNTASRLLGGHVSFVWALLSSLAVYRKRPIRIVVDDVFDREIVSLNVVAANGQYHGGGMCIAPGALVDDGLLQVTVVGNLSLGKVFWHFPKLYTGNIYNVAQVTGITGRRVEASADQQIPFETDGETPGRLPVSIHIVPNALPLITPE